MLQVLKSILKRSKPSAKPGGFTLIELLVAIAMAGLIITPLLGFVIGILNSDRREQAKARTEQELQAALDFIARDLEQAVFIYDADALTTNHADSPNDSGIQDQIPPSASIVPSGGGCNNTPPTSSCTPILVFWKREFVPDVIKRDSAIDCSANPEECDDTHVLSLVGYYLIEDDGDPWSDAARIARFQIKDGVLDPNNGFACCLTPRDAGFQPFDLNTLNGNSIKEKMSRWENAGSYTQPTQVLIDYVDRNTGDEKVPVNCPTGSVLIPESTTDPGKTEKGFYACVDSDNTLARVFIRGNIQARLGNKADFKIGDANFPTTSVQVRGRGVLGGG